MNRENQNIMDIKSVSKYTTLSKSTIYKKINEDQIPYHKIGSRTLFIQDEIEDWIRNDGVMMDKIPEMKTIKAA
jgi:excisionase family DNA binding protein